MWDDETKYFSRCLKMLWVVTQTFQFFFLNIGLDLVYYWLFTLFTKYSRQVREASKNALIYVDAVHFAPHLAIDVQELDCDFCVCSTFKFFGPHCGMLFGKASLMRALRPYKLSVSADTLPGPTQFQRWETGTLNFEGLAGIRAVMDYFASIADRFGNYII